MYLVLNSIIPSKDEQSITIVTVSNVNIMVFSYIHVMTYKNVMLQPSTKAEEEESLENVFKMSLILVTIILSLLCVAISIVFYISRQQ